MAHTIVTDICEGVADCVGACPVACIHEGPGKNTKGTDWYWIDFSTCIDCGICLQVCPVEGAILGDENPELQRIPQKLETPTSKTQEKPEPPKSTIQENEDEEPELQQIPQ